MKDRMLIFSFKKEKEQI